MAANLPYLLKLAADPANRNHAPKAFIDAMDLKQSPAEYIRSAWRLFQETGQLPDREEIADHLAKRKAGKIKLEDVSDLPVGCINSHFFDSGAFTIWTLAEKWHNERPGSDRWGYYETDEFFDYCVTAETKILTADLRWIDAGNVKFGDKLLGFDENRAEKPKSGRNWRLAEVLSVERIQRPCYKLTFDDGTVVTCSSEHKWLTASSASSLTGNDWIRTEDMRAGTERPSSVVKPLDVWEQDLTWSGGYLSASFEAEGCLSWYDNSSSNKSARGTYNLSFAQKDNCYLARVLDTLTKLNYSVTQHTLSNGNKIIYIAGGLREKLRFLGSIRPNRLLSKFDVEKLGRMTKDLSRRAVLVTKEFVGIKEVIAIKTSTGTYVANGLASHNCDSYAAFIKRHSIGIDHYANVDAIGNAELTWRNQKYLEREHSLKPVPVVHYKTDHKWLRHYVDLGYGFIGLGGLVGSTSQDSCRAWIDTCFDIVCDSPDRLPRVRIHGFGVTSYSLLIRYPWYSVDSTSWTKSGAFGTILIPHKRGGGWDFSVEPYQMKVSIDSPDRKASGRHVLTLTDGEKKIVQEWLDYIGIPLGKMNDQGEVEEYGVVTRHTERRQANLHFFEMMRAALPPYPWPFKSTRRKGLGIF